MGKHQETPGWQQIAGCLLLPVLLPLMVILIPILNALGLNKSRAGPEYLVEYLEKFVGGTEGNWDLDDFCSVPLADAVLEEIRLEACDYLPVVTDDVQSDEDREALKLLLEKARALQKEE